MALGLVGSLWLAGHTALLGAAVWCDATVRRIPNRIVFPGAVVALVLAALPGGIGLGRSVSGCAAGFAALLPFYLMGVTGAGDVKLLAAVGAFVGFPGVLGVALITFVAGGVMSALWMIRSRTLGAALVNIRVALFTGAARVASGNLPRVGDFPVSGQGIPYAVAIAIGAGAYVLLIGKFG
jgi:prepilin peptidase CpaA